MQYFRKEKILDVTDCDFRDLEHMEKSIAGSIASKIGISELRMTKKQIAWYKALTQQEKFKDKNLLEGNDRRKIK